MRPDNPRPLRLVFWESTAACNLRCRHCRRLDELDSADPEELTTDEAIAFIDALVARQPPPILVFSGGEPLVRPDWPLLLDHAKARGLPCAVATNGTLVDASVAQRLAAAGVHRVSVSLDGADAETHEGLRQEPGCFEGALAGLAQLRAAGVPTQVNCTITRRNHRQLEDLHALTIAVGAMALHLFVLVPVGCGAGIQDADALDAEETEAVLRWAAQRSLDSPLELRPTCAPQYQRVLREVRRELQLPAPQRPAHGAGGGPPHQGGCLAAEAITFVSHRGEVFPCGYLPLVCGSVRSEGLDRIWDHSVILRSLRDRSQLHGRCGACGYRSVCGGCRARALGSHGDLHGEEPGCTHQVVIRSG